MAVLAIILSAIKKISEQILAILRYLEINDIGGMLNSFNDMKGSIALNFKVSNLGRGSQILGILADSIKLISSSLYFLRRAILDEKCGQK